MSGIDLANIHWLWALGLIPLLALYYFWRNPNNRATVSVPTFGSLANSGFSLKEWTYHGLIVFRLIALGLIIFVLARPQSSSSWEDVNTEGIDIVVCLDISGSMLAEDFEPNRLEASKEVAKEFIEGRPNDRIGLVVYAGESFTQCPLTTDHTVVKNLFQEVQFGQIQDGTAIGMGLATAVNRLKKSDAKSKVIILLTDGQNTTGAISPVTAADIAKTYGIRVYTIGVGTNGQAPFPVETPFGRQYRHMDVKIDEETLTSIADLTDGQYFRATDNDKLAEVYREIDKLEKSKTEVTEYRKKAEEFFPYLLAAVLLLGLEYLIRNTYLRALV
ncbi:VWA domain-containing protein [bacterium SCSIO 12741]|nr:VWA domain-containing protein [bacterium SCSIO 12741]